MASSERLFDFDATTTTAAADAMIERTAISVPQWVIDVHDFRKRLFLRTIEPIIELLLGPAAHNNNNNHHTDFEYDATILTDTVDAQHRRLSFLPSYVEDVSYLRANSMTFATLTMMLFIMFIISLVFLSCFYHNQKTAPLFVSPRRHRLPNLVPPPLPVDGPFNWVKVCLFISDEEVSAYDFRIDMCCEQFVPTIILMPTSLTSQRI
eukprot:scaffold27078_cov168-Skeletonema_menzelii.AAC.3